MLENKFQANLIKKIKKLYPNCVVVKNDPTYMQGIPDLLVLEKDKWASLECKKCENCIYENGISTCQRMKNYIENGGNEYENQ